MRVHSGHVLTQIAKFPVIPAITREAEMINLFYMDPRTAVIILEGQ